MKFNELSINENILKAINELGYEEMMPIQEKAIPFILDGMDVIGQAQTGTGKTAAFGIPLIQISNPEHEGVEHLIVSPTRELATQIKNELETLAKYTKIKVGLILGGVSYDVERRMLKSNPNIIVGTPGRLLDHIKNKKLDLSHLKSLTLDEADEMLDIGFKEELNELIANMPEERQSLLFSATISDGVKAIAEKMLEDPIEVMVSTGLKAASSISQYAVICDESDKFKILLRFLQIDRPETAIIFGRTKKRVDELSKALNTCGIKARGLHGDLTQKERANVMDAFRSGQINVLVATDVAARGIHVDGVEVVYNFDLPQEIEYYVHRIGRTGRANLDGRSVSFVRPVETAYLSLIEYKTKGKIQVIEQPSNNNVKRAKRETVKKLLQEACEGPVAIGYYDVATDLIAEFGAERALSAALQLILPKKIESDDIKLSSEPPVYVKLPERFNHHNKNGKGKKDFKGGFRKDGKKETKKDFSKKPERNNHHRGAGRNTPKNNTKKYK